MRNYLLVQFELHKMTKTAVMKTTLTKLRRKVYIKYTPFMSSCKWDNLGQPNLGHSNFDRTKTF